MYVKMASKHLQNAWDGIPAGGKTMLELAATYSAWIVIHTASANAYPYFCASTTFKGFITSPFMVPAPHCRALLWCINSGAAGIDAMWLTCGTWLSAKAFKRVWEKWFMQREIFHSFRKPNRIPGFEAGRSLIWGGSEKSVKNLPLHVGKGTWNSSKKTDHNYGKAKIDLNLP